jgi:hypothetical protein
MGTINELNTTDTLADDDKLVIWKDQAGATRAITAEDAATYFSLAGGPYQPLDELLTAIAGLGPSTAAGDFIELTAQDTVRVRKLTVATYAALTVIPASFRFDDMLVYVASRSTDGDGGQGWWRFDAASSATANGGTILAPDAGTGRWIRNTSDNIFVWDWWGTTAAALSSAFAAIGTAGGVVRARKGGDYTLTTQVTCDKDFVTLDIRGCIIRPRFTAGAAFKFGNGATFRQQIAVIGDGGTFIDGGTGGSAPQHPLFEVRGVRGFTTRGIFAGDLWQVIKWGDPADAIHSSWWNDLECDWNMRPNASGGHSDAVQADGATGRWITTSSYEGSPAAVAGTQALFRTTSAQLSSASPSSRRFDELVRGAGSIWKYFDHGLYCSDSRLVNYAEDKTARTDDMYGYAHFLETGSGATQGGAEQLCFGGIYGGGPGSGGIRILSGNATHFYAGINIDIEAQKLKGRAVSLETTGLGIIRGVNVTRIACNDYLCIDANQDVLYLDGDIEGMFDGITLTGGTGAPDARYVVYNNTATARRVKIGANILWDAVGTAVIYDPNIGNLAIGRFCALRADGSQRRSYTYFVGVDNVGASTSLGNMFATTGGVASAYWFPAPERGRMIEIGAGIVGTIVSGTLTIGAYISGAIDTNLDYSFTSADGANPDEAITYVAGTAAIAKGAKIEARYTSASLNPTTLEATAVIVFQEM